MDHRKKRLIVIASESIESQMAGPAIRSWEMATALSKHFEIYLISPNKPSITSSNFEILWEKDPKFKKVLKDGDGVITQGITESPFQIIFSKKPFVIDLYVPYWFELLEIKGKSILLNKYLLENRIHLLLKRGDFFICASAKQRDLWLGALASVDRITRSIYHEDKLGNTLIDIVPFGISETSPVKKKDVIKGPLIQPTDKLILWNGGLWKWLDPFTLIKAMDEIRKQREDIKLLFLGTHHPNPGPVEVEILDEAIQLTKTLGIYSKNVFFNDTWIPYDERQDYLLEADVGVSLHFKSLESLFSFRTRLIDCIWTTLPIVCTEGDFFADLVTREGLGIVVKPGDAVGVKDGILRILEDPDFKKKCKDNLKRISNNFFWSKCIRPIELFFNQPHLKKRRDSQKTFSLLHYFSRICWGHFIYRFYLSQ